MTVLRNSKSYKISCSVHCPYDYVHSMSVRVENGTKKLQKPGRSCVKPTFQPELAIWKRFLNDVTWKRNPWLCRVNRKYGTFSSRFSVEPSLSQNSNLNCFLCYFLCHIWGLSELSLTCQHILTASREHTKTLPFYFGAGNVWI